ncbi:hypothetical protein [Nocardia sp. NPDC019255]|uniref:hypothetical protein n=1 Tax=unclassified Nocardia TaxID=2637762 RepID=UPI0033D46331
MLATVRRRGDQHDSIDAGGYLLTGRSLSEYRAMFSLGDDDLRGDILDCPGGAASSAAEAAELGARVGWISASIRRRCGNWRG